MTNVKALIAAETETLENDLVEVEMVTSPIVENDLVELEIKTKAPKKAKKAPGPKYPFRSKKDILEQVGSDDSFMLECLQVMYSRQTEQEQETKSTFTKNARGFMSSHAVKGSSLALKATSDGLSSDEMGEARGIVLRYGKQLAEHFREEAIRQDPSLNEIAKIFSANV